MTSSDIELLAPAGDFEKLKFAIHYGADAVYLSGTRFGLRAYAGNFSTDELVQAVEYAHKRHVKVYVTVNMYPHNEDLLGLEEYLHVLEDLNIDALIVADPGVYRIIQRENIHIPIHISTQATSVNWSNVLFWGDLPSVERVVLARELSLNEITEIHRKAPYIELETFIHGAMCMSYSGRCLLSNYLAGRDANKGACAQPCRWRYALVEEKRPGKYFPIEEDKHGSYIFNSHDLCLLEHLNDIIQAGVKSLKIEGRMKSIFYVATVVRAYRKVLDSISDSTSLDISYWRNELDKISHRPYTTGFYYGRPEDNAVENEHGGYIKPYDFCGIVLSYDKQTGTALIEERNKICVGETVEFIGQDYTEKKWTIDALEKLSGESVDCIASAQEHFKVKLPFEVKSMDIIRRSSKHSYIV